MIEDLFPISAATGRLLAASRKMFEAILWTSNTGAKWRELHSEPGAWQTVFKIFDRWNVDETLQAIVDRMSQFVIDNKQLNGESWCIDGTILRAHPCAAGGAKKTIHKNQVTTLKSVLAAV